MKGKRRRREENAAQITTRRAGHSCCPRRAAPARGSGPLDPTAPPGPRCRERREAASQQRQEKQRFAWFLRGASNSTRQRETDKFASIKIKSFHASDETVERHPADREQIFTRGSSDEDAVSRNQGINIFRRRSVSWRPGSPVTLRVGCEEPPPQRGTRGRLFVRGKVGLSRVQKHCSSVSREESLAEGSRQVAANDVCSSVRHGVRNVGAAVSSNVKQLSRLGSSAPQWTITRP